MNILLIGILKKFKRPPKGIDERETRSNLKLSPAN